MNVVIISIADVKLHIIAKKLYIPVSGVLLLLRHQIRMRNTMPNVAVAIIFHQRKIPPAVAKGIYYMPVSYTHLTLPTT